jgi:hypothetical protein
MAIEILNRTETADDSVDTRDTLFMLGGISLMVFGAGLILTNPIVRRYMGKMNIGSLAQAAIPDVERYLKLRAM